MAENKTKPTEASATEFVSSVENPIRRGDAQILLEMFGRLTGMQPVMWGESLIGYGHYHYKYASGREGDYFLTGFAPRQSATTIYVMPGFKKYNRHLEQLGPHRHSVSCLYVTRLNKINMSVLEDMICDSVQRMQDMYEWKP